MDLTYIYFWITCFPSFMMEVLSLGNFCQVSRMKMLLFAKLFDTPDSLYFTIRGSNNERFHLAGLGIARCDALLRTHRASRICKKSLFDSFFSWFLTKMRDFHLFAGFKRVFCSVTRASYAVKIKASFTERLQFIEPILLSRYQGYRKHQFQDLEYECIRAVLIPGALQDDIVMNTASKKTNVGIIPLAQVNCATNIETSCCNADNLVYTRCIRNRGLLNRVIQWGHDVTASSQVVSLEAALYSSTRRFRRVLTRQL